MYRVVLDPYIMLRGLLNRRGPCARLLFDYSDRYRAVFSEGTIRAIRMLVLHPFLVAAFPHLAHFSQSRLAQAFLPARLVQVESEPEVSIFVTTARAAQADFLVSEDPTLLANQATLGVPVIDARAFLSLLDPDFFPSQTGQEREE
jgi:predicted nucleic acid-binding protein